MCSDKICCDKLLIITEESEAMRKKTELISLVPRRFGLFTSQINPRGPRKGRASLEQHIAPGYEAVN
jgi:hypothetical protein